MISPVVVVVVVEVSVVVVLPDELLEEKDVTVLMDACLELVC